MEKRKLWDGKGQLAIGSIFLACLWYIDASKIQYVPPKNDSIKIKQDTIIKSIPFHENNVLEYPIYHGIDTLERIGYKMDGLDGYKSIDKIVSSYKF